MSLILSVFGVVGPELWALDFTKNALFCLVYNLANYLPLLYPTFSKKKLGYIDTALSVRPALCLQ